MDNTDTIQQMTVLLANLDHQLTILCITMSVVSGCMVGLTFGILRRGKA